MKPGYRDEESETQQGCDWESWDSSLYVSDM